MLLKTRILRSIALFLFFSFSCCHLFAQTQNGLIDAPGDIAFIAWNDGTTGTDDGFAFILMDKCPNGTTVTFTDEEWNGSAFSSNTSEGEVTWTNDTGSEVAKGTVIIIERANMFPTVNIGKVVESELGVNFNSAGDQWYAFTGPDRANYGTFLAFYGPLANGATIAGTGLVFGETAIEFNGEYMYIGPTDSNADMLGYLQMIYDSNNWIPIDDGASPHPFPNTVPTQFTGPIFISCDFISMVAGTQTACDPATNTYTQEVTLTYDNAPGTGTLDIFGQSFQITGSPQIVTLIDLNADELFVNVTANFSDNPGCSISKTGLFQAPPPCCTDVRLSAVNPNNGYVTIKNCGDCSLDVSNYRLNSEYSFTDNLYSLPLINGTMTLQPNDEVTVQWTGIASQEDGGADLALYTPSGSFVVTNAIVDFVQWGTGGNGWEQVAHDAGIWTAGTFINSEVIPPYIYTDATCTNHGLSEWTGTSSVEELTKDVCTSTDNANASGSNLWQHLTVGGSVIASIKDNGNNLGEVNADFYINSGAIRGDGNQVYLDRSIYINPTIQPSTPVTVRIYLTADELNAIIAASGDVSGINDLNISKFSNATCASTFNGSNGVVIESNSITAGILGANHYLEFNVDGFSGFFPQSKASILPVELVYFNAEQKEKDVLVSWATASEINNDFFVVERSYDGQSFEQVGFVKGAGTDNTRNDYEFIDDNFLPKKNLYYRLVQMDFDGTSSTSEIDVVKFEMDEITAQLVPNLVTSKTTISFSHDLRSETTYFVFNITGTIFKQGKIPTGINSFELDIDDLTGGTYFIKLVDNKSYYYSTRFVKVMD